MPAKQDKLSLLRKRLLNASEKSIEDFIAVAEQKIDLSLPEDLDESDVSAVTDAVSVQIEKAHTILKAKKSALEDGLDLITRISAEREKQKLEESGEGSGDQGSFISRNSRR